MHSKFAKSTIMTQTKFFVKNINTGIRRTQNFMLISNSLMPAFKKLLKKLKAKNHEKMYLFKGAQAFDIRERVFYRNQNCTDR